MDCLRQLASSIACLSQGFQVSATTGVQMKSRRVKSAEVPTNVKEVVARFVPLRYWMASSRDLTAQVHTIVRRTVTQY